MNLLTHAWPRRIVLNQISFNPLSPPLNLSLTDLPPSLDSLADQVAGVQSASSGTERIATVTPATVSAKPSPSSSFGPTAPGGVKKECSKASGGFKKGFFDAKPVKKVAPAAAAGASEASSIPYLRAGGSGSSALPSSSARPSDHIHVKAGQPGKAIPEFLRVEPDAMGLQSAEAKKKIVGTSVAVVDSSIFILCTGKYVCRSSHTLSSPSSRFFLLYPQRP